MNDSFDGWKLREIDKRFQVDSVIFLIYHNLGVRMNY